MPVTNHLGNAILNELFQGTAFSPPSAIHVGLFSVVPNLLTGASGTETTGTSYARVSVTRNNTNFPSSTAQSITNGAIITFPTPGSGGWGNAVGWGIWDAASSGNLWVANFFNSTVNVASCTTTSGSATVTTSASFSGLVVAGVRVTGTGIAADTRVSAVGSATSLTLSQNATASGTVTLTFTTFKAINSGDTVQFNASNLTITAT